MNPGHPLVHLCLAICHPIRVLAKLVLDIPIPLGCGVVILDRVLDSELEDLKKCLVVTLCSDSNTSDLSFKGDDLYEEIRSWLHAWHLDPSPLSGGHPASSTPYPSLPPSWSPASQHPPSGIQGLSVRNFSNHFKPSIS